VPPLAIRVMVSVVEFPIVISRRRIPAVGFLYNLAGVAQSGYP
jgi:hypothetical protein